MLQRIQSVYLFMVFLFGIFFLSFPLGHFFIEGISYPLTISGITLPETYDVIVTTGFLRIIILVLFFSILILTVYTTFQFRRRLLQIKLGKLNILLHVAIIVAAFLYIDNIREQLQPVEFNYGAGIFFPVVAMIFILLANRAIRRDEELIRSSERIR
jgi:hypothetical protein